MPSPEELRYSAARDKIDEIIRNSSSEVQKHLKLLAQERSKITISLLNEWAVQYKNKIRGFDVAFDSKNLQILLGEAYFQYMKYSFIYRFLNGLNNNSLFHKIFSFEIHFFTKVGVLRLEKAQTLLDSSDDENLFYISPLGHFLHYKLQKEYHVTPRDLSAIQDKIRLYDFLLDVVRTSFIDFFSQFKVTEVIPLDSFREFLHQPNNTNIQAIFKRIEKRSFEIN
ncbi:hypothetical protein BEN44_17035 [Leptospira interrogans serovar Ricardi]|uniref:hypothetical protein n=1 Tax=Leptospira interrogans TaxID=173 RepID=UPI002158EA7A|nr:hypothetical protein [Leptospira interrogans]MCR8640277.1 hypothetical protein [Leptospira interrogans serovar Ricardi]